jgi:trk system potassium uptake protein TrkH
VLVLFQLGGLGVMTLALLVLHSLSNRVRNVAGNTASSTLMSSFFRGHPKRTLALVLGGTLMLEAAGAISLFGAITEPNAGWKSVFLSVSAFCNAGFDNLDVGLEPYAGHWGFGLPLMLLWLFGGLGFLVPAAIWANRFDPEVRLVLWASALLIPLGALLFWVFEKEGLLQDHSAPSRWLLSFFQGNTSRTAGFSMLDLGDARRVTLLTMIPLMLIGGASGGTAGGMKIGTVLVFLAGLWAYLRGHKRVHFMKHTLPMIVVRRAFLVVTLMLLSQGVLATALTLFESGGAASLEAILFESASALGTVGLSTGITASLSPASQIALAIGMFLGRLGPLTLIWALVRQTKDRTISYPERDFPIG